MVKDKVLRLPDGTTVGTLCGACGRMKRDALTGPNRSFIKVRRYCNDATCSPTATLVDVAVEAVSA